MTSLRQQLKNLAVPQTSNLADSKKRVSILFDSNEAASKDRKSIYELGCKGLAELIVLNPAFAQYEDTLFHQSMLNLERSVEELSFNKELDRNIKKFCCHLSPYFMLRSAHMCIEWLIRRFKVHEYNNETFLCLILPYHETNIFVKCIQILKVKNPADRWNWLYYIQKFGKTLPKSVIINRATTEPSFLTFVCKNVVYAAKELGTEMFAQQCQINFYCSVIIGVIYNCSDVKEWQLIAILPSLLKGLKSRDEDFVSASFMIISQLVGKTRFTKKLLTAIVGQICKIDFASLQSSVILLLNLIAKTQCEVFTYFPQEAVIEFISKKWLTTIINNLTMDGTDMHFVLIPLTRTVLNLIQQNSSDSKVCKMFFETMLYEIRLSINSIKDIIGSVLEVLALKWDEPKYKEEVIDLESDSEMFVEKNVIGWYSNILQILERKYPFEFNTVIKNAMENSKDDDSRSVLQKVIRLRYTSFDDDLLSIFQNMYHANPRIRSTAVQDIVKHVNESKDDFLQHGLFKDALADRFKDDNPKVIEEVLKLSTALFIEILGCKSFAENVINILHRANIHPDTWGHLQAAALTHLTTKNVVKEYDNNLILLSVMRYLLPASNDNVCLQYIKIILQSPFAEGMTFLQKIIKRFHNQQIVPINFKKEFLDIISQSNETPRPEDLVESIQNCCITSSFQLTNLLILVTACFKTNNNPKTSQIIFNFIISECSRLRLTQFSGNLWISSTKSNDIFVQLFKNFLRSLVRGTKFTNLHDWESPNQSLELFLGIFNLLSSNAFSVQHSKIDKHEWGKYLKDILSLLFLTAREKIDFLSHFLIYDNMSNIEHFTELRIRSLQLITLILRGEDKNLDLNLKFVFKVFIALSSQISSIRTCAVNILMELQVLPVKQNLETLTKAVLERRIEIIYDAEQISLILYTISNIKKKNIKTYNAFTDGIQNIIADETENIIFKSKMLQLLKHNKDINILNFVIPVALKALETIKNSGNILVLDNSAASIFNSVIMRFDEKCIQKLLTTDKNAWELIKKSLKMAKVFTYHSTEELIPVPCITLQIFDEATFNQLPTAYKVDFLKLVIETISISNNDVLFLAINKSLKQCWIDCRHVLPLLECMSNPHYSTSTISTQSGLAKITHNDINVLTSKEWQNGVILLEVLENKKRLLNSHALIPVLFNILKKCLEMDNQLPLEYTKQLILSALLQSCQKSNVENLLCELPENTFKIDLIIQCIRITQNPQTHYNALLLLSHCASIFPQQVLHNLVDIFTFMGSSITRYDDVFSFQIISNIIDSVIPILIKDEHKTRALTNPINSVLKIFSDILLDVPEHRRLPLYLKLLKTLGAEKYLWLFLCTVFESHVINNENIKPMERKGIDRITVSLPSEKLPKRIEMALKLLNQFDIDISLSTCVSLMEYVKSLPIDKEGPSSKTSKSTFKAHDFEIFDIETKSAKQLRHYKYLILQFISMFTSSVDFSKAVNIEEKNKDTQRKAIYQNFIIKTLSFIPEVTIEIEKNKNTCQCKFWKVILHHCYDILDNIISLLSPDMFLVVVYGLMQHQLITIRKKVLELLINKLQQKPADFEKCNEKNILNLLRLLQELINTVLIKTKQDDIIVSSLKTADINEKNLVQQAGFIAIKQLSKLFALKFIDNFKNIVVVLTSILKQRNRTPKIILIAVFLTLVEVMSNLKAYSVSHLPQFMPPFIDALKDQGTILQKQAPDNMSLALITSVQKLFESMPLFLGSYTTGIITELSTIWSRINNLYIEQEQRKTLIINKLDLIWFKISNDVPARILIPGCEKSFYILVETKNYLSIPFAMKLFGACISNSSNPELSVIQTDLTIFFLKALDFRTQIGSHGGNLTNEEINKIEQEIINAFVVWTLKLSESCFRPLYKKIHDWATRNNGPKQRVLTYFILNKYLSNSLKSLFVLFASEFVEIAAELLNACNTSKKNILFFADYEIFNTELIKNILYIFINVFKYDGSGFINTHKFDLLMQPIVDQLENNLVLNNEELQNILMSCIGEFAVAISSDVLWKQLNYHILLKTRVNIPKARIIAFNCCLELAKKLVDDFTSLLPDTIPFVAELFEDENPEVVKNSRAAVRELETVLGESLQKYL